MDIISFLVIGSLSFLIGGFVFITLAKMVNWRDARVNWLLARRNEDAWQKLADTYGLTYVPGEELGQAHLFGIYRQCQLSDNSLRILRRTFTVIEAGQAPEAEPLSLN